jgi:hypothetical protein
VSRTLAFAKARYLPCLRAIAFMQRALAVFNLATHTHWPPELTHPARHHCVRPHHVVANSDLRES